MRSMILAGCLWVLSQAGFAQNTGHIQSGTPLRWSQNGSIEIMPEQMAYYYGRKDTASDYKKNITRPDIVLGGNPISARFSSVNAQCNSHVMMLNWSVTQQTAADHFEVEQSNDNGRSWTVVGEVPANRSQLGTSPYSFTYNKDIGNAIFRVTASDIGGERVSSATVSSPCSIETELGVTNNPVVSTTTLRIGSPTATKIRVALVNTQGTLAYATDASVSQGSNQFPIDMSHMMPGAYDLVLDWYNGRHEVIRLVKQ